MSNPVFFNDARGTAVKQQHITYDVLNAFMMHIDRIQCLLIYLWGCFAERTKRVTRRNSLARCDVACEGCSAQILCALTQHHVYYDEWFTEHGEFGGFRGARGGDSRH